MIQSVIIDPDTDISVLVIDSICHPWSTILICPYQWLVQSFILDPPYWYVHVSDWFSHSSLSHHTDMFMSVIGSVIHPWSIILICSCQWLVQSFILDPSYWYVHVRVIGSICHPWSTQYWYIKLLFCPISICIYLLESSQITMTASALNIQRVYIL